MRQNSNDYLKDLEFLIDEIKRNNSNTIAASKKIIEVLNDKIHNLHIWLSGYTFPSPEEEIQFFKEQKPLLVSKIIYYNKIIDIESNLPIPKEYKIKFINKEIDKIIHYFDENSFFCQYYRSGAIDNDQKYFTRTRDKNLNYYECHIINYDIRVSTSHDYNVAQILANDQLVFYLEDKLEQIENNSKPIQTKLNWTGNRIDFIELLYALQSQKVINEGSLEMKEFSIAFSQIFNIDIEDSIYRSYYDMKSRKSNRTKFLNTLSETLNNKMNQDDF